MRAPLQMQADKLKVQGKVKEKAMRYINLSWIFILLFITTDSMAYTKYYQRYPAKHYSRSGNTHRNYKGEDYKGEVVRAPCPPEVMLRDGLYVGGELGYDSYRIRQSVSVIDSSGYVDQANPQVSARGIVGGLFAGYGRYFDTFYIAGEVLTTYSGANAGFGVNNYRSTVKAQSSYGASILPGVKVNDTSLFYGRVGYLRTYFKAQEGGVPTNGGTTTNWGNGLDLGVGIETVVYQNVSARAEYHYTFYDSFNSNLGTSFRPTNSEFMLAGLYRFDFM